MANDPSLFSRARAPGSFDHTKYAKDLYRRQCVRQNRPPRIAGGNGFPLRRGRTLSHKREAALCRELTKMFEEVLRLPLRELSENLERRETIKGEIVLVVAPPDKATGDHGDSDAALKAALKKLSVKDAAALVAALTGQSKKDLYTRALEIKGKS